MEQVEQKKGFKEFIRKFIVSLKKRTTKIPQFVMVIAFIIYSFSLSTISNTTAFINKTPMGLCSFVSMLVSILAFVTSLNAYPNRAKPKRIFEILLYAMQAILIGSDILYLVKIQEGLSGTSYRKDALAAIYGARTVLIIHLIFVGLTIILFALVPLIRKLLMKIDTSVDLGENEDMKKIELEDED